jgi:peptidoglycan/LPS O-acetylase OafA/YrhL
MLRGLAALAVLLHHVPHVAVDLPHRSGLLFFPMEYGARGVTLFLVISGFCIHLGAAQRLSRGQGASCSWTAFWKRRFFRLYPPYLAAIFFSLIVSLFFFWQSSLFSEYRNHLSSPAWDVASHVFMVHNLMPTCIWGLGNPVFWTLGLEEQLYALYAVLLLLRWRLPAGKTFLVTLAVTLLWCACNAAGPELVHSGWVKLSVRHAAWTEWWFKHVSGMWPYWPLGVWATWSLGALAAEAYTGAVKLPRWCYRGDLALVCAGMGFLFFLPALGLLHVNRLPARLFGADSPLARIAVDFFVVLRIGELSFAAGSFILLNRWVRAEVDGKEFGTVRRWLAGVGRMSYSLYLTHFPLIVGVESLAGRLGLRQNATMTLVRYAFYVPTALLVSWAFFQLVERHFLTSNSPPKPLAADLVVRRAA